MARKISREIGLSCTALLFACSMLFSQEKTIPETSINLVFNAGLTTSLASNGSTIGGQYGLSLDHRINKRFGFSAGMSYWLLNIPRTVEFQSPSIAANWSLLETQALFKFYPFNDFNFSLIGGPSHGIIIKEDIYLDGLLYNTIWANAGIEYTLKTKSALNVAFGALAKTGNIYEIEYGQIFVLNLFAKLGLSSLRT